VARLARAVDAAEARVRAEVPIARLIFLEPDLRRPTADLERATSTRAPFLSGLAD
jgi:hypothetical protein